MDVQSTLQVADPLPTATSFSCQQFIAISISGRRSAKLLGNRVVGSVHSIVFFLHRHVSIFQQRQAVP
jgi:hypothetical protein